MAKRSKQMASSAEAGGSTTDLMTCLIGCLILVFIGILIMVLIAAAMVRINDMDNAKIISPTVSRVDGFREDRAFPQGNTFKEPTYLDVRRDRVIIHPNNITVLQRDLFVQRPQRKRGDLAYDFMPGGEMDLLLRAIQKGAADEYVILCIRPGASTMAKEITALLDERGIDVGRELFSSDRVLDHVSKTRAFLKEKREAEKSGGKFDYTKAAEKAAEIQETPPPPGPETP